MVKISTYLLLRTMCIIPKFLPSFRIITALVVVNCESLILVSPSCLLGFTIGPRTSAYIEPQFGVLWPCGYLAMSCD